MSADATSTVTASRKIEFGKISTADHQHRSLAIHSAVDMPSYSACDLTFNTFGRNAGPLNAFVLGGDRPLSPPSVDRASFAAAAMNAGVYRRWMKYHVTYASPAASVVPAAYNAHFRMIGDGCPMPSGMPPGASFAKSFAIQNELPTHHKNVAVQEVDSCGRDVRSVVATTRATKTTTAMSIAGFTNGSSRIHPRSDTRSRLVKTCSRTSSA
mmetsp:Transcript_2968/g.13403  ORF Transcript_2968/g.13403 Transcript_2968/m.13403 type:complete len:212 (-) Transcript_2968:64-699(-)